MSYTYHLLTEVEPFSEHHGGAISRWAANVLQREGDSCVLAPSADQSWHFAPSRVRQVPALLRYKRLMDSGGHRFPLSLRFNLIRRCFTPHLADLEAGQTVWVHNRPEFAAALAPFVHGRSARLVLHLHNSHLAQWSSRIVKRTAADVYVFISNFIQGEALAKYPGLGKTVILNNGADESLFAPPQEPRTQATPVVLFASRLVPDKGLHVFLDAMAQLHECSVPLQGVVVGGSGFGDSRDSTYVREMKQRATANVRFEPYCAGIALADTFRRSDIFCLPACWDDGFPLTVLEAMATGLPVVATHSGGIPEQLRDGGGILVPKNDPSQLAQALQQLAGDAGLRESMGRQGRLSFERRFTWGTVHTNYRRILDQPWGQPALTGEPLWNAAC